MSIPKPKHYWKFNDGKGTRAKGSPVDKDLTPQDYELRNDAAQEAKWGPKAWTPEGLLVHGDKTKGAYKVRLSGNEPVLSGKWTVTAWVKVHKEIRSTSLLHNDKFALRVKQYPKNVIKHPVGITKFGTGGSDARFVKLSAQAGKSHDKIDNWCFIDTDKWTHLAMVSAGDDEGFKLYLDGALVAEKMYNKEFKPSDIKVPFRGLGSRKSTASPITIRELMIFDRVLNADEVKEVMESGKLEYLVISNEDDRILLNGGDDHPSWGTVDDGETRTFTIRNIGDKDLQVNRISLSEGAQFKLSKAPPSATILGTGQELTFELVFRPNGGDGERQAQVRVKCDDATTPEFSFNVAAKYDAEPKLEVKHGDDKVINDKIVPWGQQAANAKTWLTITNQGRDTLKISQISIDGQFKLSPDTAKDIPAKGTHQVAVTFDPTGDDGLRTGVVRIKSDDPDHPDFSFTIEATYQAKAPALEVKENASPLTSGAKLPWDTATVDATRTFTLYNHGKAPLMVSSLSSSSSEFEIFPEIDGSPLSVGVNQSRSITVKFTPTGSDGDRNTKITIKSNDPTNPEFVIKLAFHYDARPIMVVSEGATPLPHGKTANWGDLYKDDKRYITLNNIGRDVLKVSSISVSEPFALRSPQKDIEIAIDGEYQFAVLFKPKGSEGTRSGKIVINSDDANHSAYTFTIKANHVTHKPAMQVEQANGVVMAHNQPRQDWKTVNADTFRTYTIHNNGKGDLLVSAVTSSSKHFQVSPAIGSRGLALGPGQHADFTLTFKPRTDRDARYDTTVTIKSDDPKHPRFTFRVRATYDAKPQLVVSESGKPVEHHGLVRFGDVAAKTSKFIRLTNQGRDRLRVSKLTVTGAFQLVSPKGAFNVNESRHRDIKLEFKPTGGEGPKQATLEIHSDDPNRPLFRINLEANYLYQKPRLQVFEQTVEIEQADVRDWKGVSYGATRPLTVKNLGRDTLRITRVTSTSKYFEVTPVTSSAVRLSWQQSRNYTITFKPPNRDGVQNATITIYSNDPRDTTFKFSVRANHQAEPQLVVLDGDDTVAQAATRSWGELESGDKKFLTIRNDGRDTLNVRRISANAHFHFNPSSVSLKPGKHRDIEVTFSPHGSDGYRQATVKVDNNDPGRGSFWFTLAAQLDDKPAMVIQRLSPAVLLDHGEVTRLAARSPGFEFPLNINNAGKDDLVLTQVRCTGQGWELSPIVPRGFRVAEQQLKRLILTYRPPADGTHRAQLDISSDDPTQPNYTHYVEAKAVGIHPLLKVTEAGKVFGNENRWTGELRKGRTVWYTLENVGKATLDIKRISITDKTFFHLGMAQSRSIQPGQSENFSLQLVRDVGDEESAQTEVVIESNDHNNKRFSFQVRAEPPTGEGVLLMVHSVYVQGTFKTVKPNQTVNCTARYGDGVGLIMTAKRPVRMTARTKLTHSLHRRLYGHYNFDTGPTKRETVSLTTRYSRPIYGTATITATVAGSVYTVICRYQGSYPQQDKQWNIPR